MAVEAAKPQAIEITPDTQIFKRTPKIDGTIEDGEWDTYYILNSDGIDTTTYADWDSQNLYLAVKANKPVDLLALLDANADGWLNGEDNYQFEIIKGALSLSRYDSRHSRTAAPVAATPAEATMVEVRSGTANGMNVIEMRIPADLIRGFKLSAERKIGLLLSVKPADATDWIPSSAPGDTRECTLVTKKIVSLKPLDLGFDLRYPRIARGEELVAKFHMTNIGAETVDAQTFVIAGEGKSGEYLNSEKIRMDGLAPRKHLAHDVRSIIPMDMPLGSWALGAEVKSGDKRLGGALVSFDVVEPFEIELNVPDRSVKADVKDVTIGVVITNNMRHSVRGDAKITLPVGWELWKDSDKRDFAVSGEAISSVTFKAKPPLGALGNVPVKVDVTINGKTVSAEGKFNVVNP